MAPDLDAQLLQAHAAGDKAALITLYTQAADKHPRLTLCVFS